MIKESQFHDLDGILVSPDHARSLLDIGDLQVEIELDADSEEEQELLESGPKIEGNVFVSSDDDEIDFEAKKEFSFTLPKVPGSDDKDEIEEPSEIDTFLEWLSDKLKNVPRHSGKDISGIEKAIAYLKYLSNEVSKANRTDINNLIDNESSEKALMEIYDGIERLEKRLDKLESIKNPMKRKKKKADEDSDGLVKQAKTIHFEVNVPYFISLIARTCINSSISAGHDIEEVFQKMAKQYELTKAQKFEVVHLIEDMGYSSVWRDRSKMLDEEIDLSSSDNGDWAAQYQS
jgi:hypothetical protein